jgi:carbon-monoxide dehydrogenase large subunit
VVKAAQRVIEKATKVAAHLLEASEDDIEFSSGRFGVKGTDKGLAIQEVVFATFLSHNFPEGIEPSLDAEYTFDPENFSFPHGTHLAAIEIDTDTGWVSLRKYVCVDDIGSVVNPLIVDGQIHGGLAQGIAQALFEEAVYDEQGTLVTGNFTGYTIPSAADLPSFDTDRTETPATTNPLGVKGVGEAGTIASTPAIVNGVLDAVRHLGVTQIEMPCTPQRVWRALQEAQGRSTAETPLATPSPGAGLGSIDPQNPQGEIQ